MAGLNMTLLFHLLQNMLQQGQCCYQHPTWVVLLAPIVISSLVMAIGKKKAQRFNYPLLVVIVYVLFGSLYGLWHPLWVLFITVPLYYSFIKLIKELRK